MMDMKEVKRNAGREGSKEKVTAEQQQFWLHFARSAVQSQSERGSTTQQTHLQQSCELY